MLNRICFDRNWIRHIGDVHAPFTTGELTKAKKCINNGAAATVDESNWEKVTLPDDYMIGQEIVDYNQNWVGGTKEIGIGAPYKISSFEFMNGSRKVEIAWYRKHFVLPESFKNKKVFIDFDGVMRNCTVYINEFIAYSQKSGFCGFSVDITDFLQENDNTIAVRVDPREIEGWWYNGAGIYRHTYLRSEPFAYFEKDSLKITSDVQNNSATLTVSGDVLNDGDGDFSDSVNIEIVSPSGKIVKKSVPVTAKVLEIGSYNAEIKIESPEIWDTESPLLYTAKVTMNNGACADSTFGIRTIKFDKDNGFMLNGRTVKLNGVCIHHDFAGVGTAQLDPIHEYRLKQLKQIGCNAIRSSHNQPTVELLDACDRLGMLFMDETRVLSSSKQRIYELEYMVKRDRNHPSVIMWSIGNEERLLQPHKETEKISKTVRKHIKKLDTVAGITEGYMFHDFDENNMSTSNISSWVYDYCDVLGFNYCGQYMPYQRSRNTDKPFVYTEQTTLSSTRDVVITNKEKCQLFIDYSDGCAFTAKQCAEYSYLCGAFYWTGFDYYGEPVPMEFPAVSSQFGILDLCGFTKDTTYFYKAMWKNDESVFHLGPHWNFVPGADKREIVLFGKFDKAELFVNGKSKGYVHNKPYDYARWENIDYEPGEISADIYKDGIKVATKTVKTTGRAVKLIAENEYCGVDKSGRKITLIKVYTTDENGNFVPTSDDKIAISATKGIVNYCESGNPKAHENVFSENVKLFNGMMRIVSVCDSDISGSVTLESKFSEKASVSI